MRCFTVLLSYTSLTPCVKEGIEVDHARDLPGDGRAVVLGRKVDESLGRRGAVGLCRNFPPLKIRRDRWGNETLLWAIPVKIKKRDDPDAREFTVLREGLNQCEDRALIVIDCSSEDKFAGRHGIWFCTHGRVEVVAAGRVEDEDGAVFAEDLVIMYPGSQAVVRFMGGEKEFLLSYDGSKTGPTIRALA